MHINISKYAPLQGSSYANLPEELCSSKKGLINILNKVNNHFRCIGIGFENELCFLIKQNKNHNN